MTIYGIALNPYALAYALAAFVALSWTAAFALGRLVRNGGSTGAWERATTTKYENLPPLRRARYEERLDAVRRAQSDADRLRAEGEYRECLAREPSPHVDGKRGE